MQKKQNKILATIRKECVLVIAIILAIITCFFSKPSIQNVLFEFINYKVLILLFNLMVIIASFRKLKVLDSLALFVLSKCNSLKKVSLCIVFITFFVSMIATNDVALLTFVPITIIIGQKCNINTSKVIIFQTLAANIGSSLTPMGNPQNLYIYTLYDLSLKDFFSVTSKFVLLGMIILFVLIMLTKNKIISPIESCVKVKKDYKLLIYIILLCIVLLSVFNVIDYRITFLLTLFFVIVLDRKLLVQVDYSLILTFIAFFIFVGNLSNMDIIKGFMNFILRDDLHIYISGIVSSQVISNVPACMLIAGFTQNYKPLLLGVNIGGLGTLIASLASLISYKLYVNNLKKEEDNLKSQYIKQFTAYNFILLIIFSVIFYFIL